MKTNINSVCNWIKYHRDSNKCINCKKRITIKLFKENNKQMSARLHVVINKNTNHITLTHSLLYMKHDYAPNINPNKLKCVDKHTIKQYEKMLQYVKQNIKEKGIYNTLCKNVNSTINVSYNVNTEHINIREYLKYKHKYIKTGLRNKKDLLK